MSLTAATWVAFGLALYVVAGVLFAIRSHIRRIDPEDPDVASGSIGFRIAITPGLIALWPLFVRRGLRPAAENFVHDSRPRP